MNYSRRPVATKRGRFTDPRVTECPDALSAPGPDSGFFIAPLLRGVLMDKWKIIKDSKFTQISVSAGTIVAVAALVGAGLKWN